MYEILQQDERRMLAMHLLHCSPITFGCKRMLISSIILFKIKFFVQNKQFIDHSIHIIAQYIAQLFNSVIMMIQQFYKITNYVSLNLQFLKYFIINQIYVYENVTHFLLLLIQYFMKISQLEVFNFKSYCGRQVIGPFHQHFTCIIGPNGNGKSNILDAMLFVFGFKSSKLRQDNLTSLIHRSAFFQPDQAKVTVKFIDNEQEIRVSRVIKKSGYCYYQLQEEKINWNQLREFLIKKGIDLQKNLFIILQGQVQRLCELDHTKLIQYLEYISGSDVFIEEIEQLQSKYVQNAIQKQQASSRLSIKRKIFKQVQQKTSHIVQWLIIKLKLMQFQHLIIKKIWIENKQEKSLVDKKIQQFQQELKKGLKILEDQNNNLKKLKKQQNLIKQKISKANKEHFQQEQNSQKTKRQINQLNRDSAYIQKDLQKLQNQHLIVIKQKSSIEQMVKNQVSLVEQFQKCRNQMNLLKVNKLYDIYNTCWKYQNEKFKSQKEIQEKKQKLRNQEEKIKEIQIKIQESKLKVSQTQKAQIKLKIRQLGQAHYSQTKKLQNFKNLIQQLKSKLSEFEDKKKNLSNHQKVINQIKMANKLKLILPNYQVSTLRENLMIAEGFESVISAVTPQLDYIVVQKYQQAKQVVDFLNVRKIGRMSFILKEQIAKIMKGVNFSIQNGRPLPANTKRMFDQCKPITEEFREIIFWAVGNTLIAQNMQVAMKAAFHSGQPYRVITMKGQFIDISGAMTKLPLKNIPNRQLQDKSVLQAKIQVLSKNIQTNEQKINEFLRQKTQLNLKLQKIQQIQINQKGFQQNSQQQLKFLQNEIKLNKKELNEKESSLRKNQKCLKIQIQKLRQKQQDYSIEKYVQTLQKIDNFQKLNSNMKKIRISSDILNQLTDKLSQIELSKRNILQKEQKHKENIRQLQQKLQKQKVVLFEKQQQKMQFNRELSAIQQKIFMKEIEVNDLEKQLNGTGSKNVIRRDSQNDVRLQKFSAFQGVNANQEGIKQKLRKFKETQKVKDNQISKAVSHYQRSLLELNKFYSFMKKKIQPIYQNFKNKQIQKKSKRKTKKEKGSMKKLKQDKENRILQVQKIDQNHNDKIQSIKVKGQIYQTTLIHLGEDQFSFSDFISQSEKPIIFQQIPRDKGIICNISQNTQIFSLIQKKKLQFFYAYEKQKLQHLFPREQSASTMRNSSKQQNNFQQNQIDCQLLQEYKKEKQQFDFQLDHYQKLQSYQKEIYQKLLKLRQNRTSTFLKVFNQINVQLNFIYNFLTKGNAQINLVNSFNPFQGAQFTVRPCGKSWKNANLLSGGQKTLTSLALIFASQQIKKFPFYFMDQIDAALDYRNTSLLAKYINQKKKVQHIVISLRKNMYQQAHALIGIFKVKDVTLSVRIDMQDLYEQDQDKNQNQSGQNN